jgi:hypothetical protein
VAISEEVRELLASGVAIVVATRDERMRPAIARAWGLELAADGSEGTLCIGAKPGSPALANLAANGAIAITCSSPSTYRTVQLKGIATVTGAPTPGQLEAVERHVEAFSSDAEQVGLPAGGGRRMLNPELVAVAFGIAEAYDQTPGPGAGARL